jgi:rare lipoprotein A
MERFSQTISLGAWERLSAVVALAVLTSACGTISSSHSTVRVERVSAPESPTIDDSTATPPAQDSRRAAPPSVELRSLPESEQVPPMEESPEPSQPSVVETGLASWYGPRFHGKLTASGEVFNQERLTAAHRTLPWGSRVKVTNLANGKSVEVRINDRGPFAQGRIIDVSRAAARALGMVRAGITAVEIEWLPGPGMFNELAAEDQPTVMRD